VELVALTDLFPGLDECNCLALRQAGRHITQFYDRYLAPAGLRTTQFAVLAKLRQTGPMTIAALAGELVMDRTTMGRSIVPLEREGLIRVVPGRTDRRSKELQLTDAGLRRVKAGYKGWKQAQARFAAVFGGGRAAGLRELLRAASAADLGAGPAGQTSESSLRRGPKHV
jgi:DNA-binding MarR family transcriptional regulator